VLCVEQVVQAVTTVGYTTKLNELLTAKKKVKDSRIISDLSTAEE
jgi:hypothetical protein